MPTTRSQDAYHSMHIRSTLRDRSMDTVAAVAVLIAVTTLGVGVCVLPGRLVVATALRRARSMLTTRSKECLLGGVRSLSVEGSSRVQNPESRVESPESRVQFWGSYPLHYITSSPLLQPGRFRYSQIKWRGEWYCQLLLLRLPLVDLCMSRRSSSSSFTTLRPVWR